MCQKYDRNFKSSGRELLVTDRHLYVLGSEKAKDGPNKGKFVKVLKRKVPFNQIQSISMRYTIYLRMTEFLVRKQMIYL